jgi:acetyltransferase-like isoleucine patch superfamily enzyme
MLFKILDKFIALLFKLRFDIVIDTVKARYQSKKLQTLREQFKKVGENFNIYGAFIVHNPKYMSLGNNFSCMDNLRLEAWDEYKGERFTPSIIIGDNVAIATDVHIGCIKEVRIGNNVLMASRIYISDHFHGAANAEAIKLPPLERPLISRGPVIIEDNVWIGEGVCIMPGVTIGKNSIIAANAVITKSVPPNSVAAGVPAVVISKMESANVNN